MPIFISKKDDKETCTITTTTAAAAETEPSSPVVAKTKMPTTRGEESSSGIQEQEQQNTSTAACTAGEPTQQQQQQQQQQGCSNNNSNNTAIIIEGKMPKKRTTAATSNTCTVRKSKRRPQSLYNIFFMGERKKILHEATLHIRKEMESEEYARLSDVERKGRLQKLEVTPERLVKLMDERWLLLRRRPSSPEKQSLMNHYYKLVDVEKERVERLMSVSPSLQTANNSSNGEIVNNEVRPIIDHATQQQREQQQVGEDHQLHQQQQPLYPSNQTIGGFEGQNFVLSNHPTAAASSAADPQNAVDDVTGNHQQQQKQQPMHNNNSSTLSSNNNQSAISQQMQYVNTPTGPAASVQQQVAYQYDANRYNQGSCSNVVNHHHVHHATGHYQGGSQQIMQSYDQQRHESQNYGGGGSAGSVGTNSYTEVVHHCYHPRQAAGQVVVSDYQRTQYAQGNNSQAMHGSCSYGDSVGGGHQQSYYTTSETHYSQQQQQQQGNYYAGGQPQYSSAPQNNHGLAPGQTSTVQYTSNTAPGGNSSPYNATTIYTSQPSGVNHASQHGRNAQGYTTTEYYVYEPSTSYGQKNSHY